MIYFSELHGKHVYNESKARIGVVKDCIFLATESANLTKLIVAGQKGSLLTIPLQNIKEINKIVVVEKDYKQSEIEENELSLVKNLLDKQIIDVKGGKVVRVNDVVIQDRLDEHKITTYYISGVDIGVRGILRWFHLEKPALPLYKLFGIYFHPHFLSWGDIEPLELSRGNVRLKKDARDLKKMHPEDLADYLEKTNIRNVDKIVTTLDEEFAAEVIGDLNVTYQTALFKRFSPERASKLIDLLDPDEAVDILLTMSSEKRREILNSLDKEKKDELTSLIKYSKTPIGHLITSEFLTVHSENTVSQALEIVKQEISDSHVFTYVYVLNEQNQLVGVIDLYKLITELSDTLIYKIMEQDVVVIHLTTPKEIAVKKLLRYKLFALPVIEDNKKIIGVITYDDLVEDILKKL